ncbi:Regulatory-associated of TOR 1 [Micractinium conductrix]|uniref:Regulatory-associated of TOR 1 n=1 Tax=Micractinium conductrix TaxID=554055 RepID=A0A2P6V3P1_9CHLO|nr:Regulatory-associated of TOR 1 [Micractinium conductrix]|eukprot:PSC68711.1 Regulatory-associated of TOR 1 [Micractinium conductrix]
MSGVSRLGEGGEPNGLGATTSASRLGDELARRLAVTDNNPAQPQASLALTSQLSSTGSGLPPPHEFTFFCEARHEEPLPAGVPDAQGPAYSAQQAGGGAAAAAVAAQQQQQQLAGGGGSGGPGEGLVSKWRQKERLKTTAVALVMCLNIGVDPPDVIKISPCARLECWVDPLSMQAPKALDTIGKNLQAQYERWQPRAKYRMHLDPTTEDVKKLAISCRRTAKGERVLFHYNGHGVPRPTANGEVWVFNKSYTQYIPLSIYDLQTWVGTPAIYVFDCSASGQILYSFRQFMFQRQQELEAGYLAHQQAAAAAAGVPGAGLAGAFERPDPMRDCILLCACGEAELLPQNPDLPADTFTASLTTPIKVALRWFCSRSLLRHEGITKELIDRIPGKQTDRKTPLGELNWVFTAITDTIAWNVLPRALFQKLFRQDLLVASLFRNFLLAERIMRAANCNPVSYPRLPPTHQHPMWQAWDMAAEMCLLQLPDLLGGDGTKDYQPSPFFSEQLTAFELWLEHGGPDKRPPEQLPIVLQVLLSQVHRLRALVLLGRFLDMGAWAVDLALSVGIFPYVLKLLQTTATDLRQTLVLIWAKIMAWDTNSQVQSDLVKDGGHLYFIKHLESRDPGVSPESRAQAAFVLAAICNRHPKGQLLCAQSGLLQVCTGQLPAALAAMASAADSAFASLSNGSSTKSMALLVRWLLLCAGKLCEDAPEITAMALREQTHELLAKLLGADYPDVRAAAVFTLGAFVQAQEGEGGGIPGAAGLAPPPASPSPTSSAGGSMPSAAGGEAAAGAAGGAAAEGPLPPAERLAIERAIACALLEVVYDASSLVRAEVAVALARVAVGHSLLFQDAVHAHQRTSARILREQQRRTQATAASAPAAAGVPRSAPTASGSIAAGSIARIGSAGSMGSAGSGGTLARRSAQPGQASASAVAASTLDQQQQQQQQHAAGTAPAAAQDAAMARSLDGVSGASPGVRLRDDLSYEPMLHVGLEHGGNLGGVYASADAARVGGGLYQAVVEALCTLATDPSPKVAAAGLAALRAANVELVQAPAAGAAGGPPGARGTAPQTSRSNSMSAQGSGAMPVGATSMGHAASGSLATHGGSAGGGMTSMLPKSWQPKSWRSASAGGGGGGAPLGSASSRQLSTSQALPPAPSGSLSGSGSAAGSPNPSPSSGGTYTRLPFVLRRAPDAGDAGAAAGSLSKESAFAEATRPLSAQGSIGSLADGGAGFGGGGGALAAPAVLPSSGIYANSCRAFTWPLLAPQSQEEPGPACATWLLPPDENKVELRSQYRHDALVRTRGVGQSSKCRLREQVTTINTETEHTTAVLLEPLRPFLVTADAEGVLRVSNYRAGGVVNRFHAALGVGGASSSSRSSGVPLGPPVSVRALYQLNELHNGLLLACAADGSVRVWRDYALRGQQRLAAAWQSVLVPPAGSAARPTVYHWSPGYSALFAAGGRSAERVYMWDLERENCIAQLNLPAAGAAGGGGSEPGGAAPAVEHIAASCHSPLLYAADNSGTVRIFDLRSSEVVGSVQHLRTRLAGMVAEPGGTPHHLVLGYPGAQLAFLDCRMISDNAAAGPGSVQQGRRLEVGVWKTVDAHSKGQMTALAAHPNAPLLATATNNQVVKVWSSSGEQVGVVRAHSSFLAAHRIGPVTCLAFAPYELLLASGSADPVAAIYSLDLAPSLPPSPARPSLPAATPSPVHLPAAAAPATV